ncbi:MAG: hypothetical protein PF481_07965 [Bacteroidales bacterium]|nr:hypothetical protein [Bacteroidales bacterium]
MFWWVVQALAIIICTILLVRLLTLYVVPWVGKKFFPHSYEQFRKKYLEPEE